MTFLSILIVWLFVNDTVQAKKYSSSYGSRELHSAVKCYLSSKLLSDPFVGLGFRLVNVEEIVKEAQQSTEAESILRPSTINSSTIKSFVHQLCVKMDYAKADSITIFSDGSATMTKSSSDNFVYKFPSLASAGLFLLPFKGNDPIFELGTGICVQHLAGAVETPLDCEMFAGFVATSLLRMISETFTDSMHRTTPIEATLVSDSKSLCKMFRVGFPEVSGMFPSQKKLPRDISAPLITQVMSRSRASIWKMMRINIVLKGKEDPLLSAKCRRGAMNGRVLTLNVEWQAGHPERNRKNNWSIHELGMWLADTIAKQTAQIVNEKNSSPTKLSIDWSVLSLCENQDSGNLADLPILSISADDAIRFGAAISRPGKL